MRNPVARGVRSKFNHRNNRQALARAARSAAPSATPVGTSPFESLEDRRLFSVIAHYYNDGFWGNGNGNAGRPTAPINQAAGTLNFQSGVQTISVARTGDVTTTVDAIDFDWGGGSPATGIRNDDHSTL